MRFCSAFGCSNGSSSKKNKEYIKSNNITFHGFPMTDKKRLKEWVDRVGRKYFVPSQHSSLCSEHFREEDFAYQPFTSTMSSQSALWRKKLKENNPEAFAEYLQKQKDRSKKRRDEKKRKWLEEPHTRLVMEEKEKELQRSRCLKWIVNSRRRDLNLKNVKHKLVCSLHFHPSDYNNSADIVTSTLGPKAVPTIVDCPNPPKLSVSKGTPVALISSIENMRLVKKTAVPSLFSHTEEASDGKKRRKTSYKFGASVKKEQEDSQSDDVHASSKVYQDQLSKGESASFQDGAFQDKVCKVEDSESEASQEEISQHDIFSEDNVSQTEESLQADSHNDKSQLQTSNIELSHNEVMQSSRATTNPATASLLSLKHAYETSIKQKTKCKRARTDGTAETHITPHPFTPVPVAIFAAASTSAETNRETVDSTQNTQDERIHAANELFGSYIAQNLSSLSPQARNWCIMEINNAIFKAQSGMWCQQL